MPLNNKVYSEFNRGQYLAGFNTKGSGEAEVENAIDQFVDARTPSEPSANPYHSQAYRKDIKALLKRGTFNFYDLLYEPIAQKNPLLMFQPIKSLQLRKRDNGEIEAVVYFAYCFAGCGAPLLVEENGKLAYSTDEELMNKVNSFSLKYSAEIQATAGNRTALTQLLQKEGLPSVLCTAEMTLVMQPRDPNKKAEKEQDSVGLYVESTDFYDPHQLRGKQTVAAVLEAQAAENLGWSGTLIKSLGVLTWVGLCAGIGVGSVFAGLVIPPLGGGLLAAAGLGAAIAVGTLVVSALLLKVGSSILRAIKSSGSDNYEEFVDGHGSVNDPVESESIDMQMQALRANTPLPEADLHYESGGSVHSQPESHAQHQPLTKSDARSFTEEPVAEGPPTPKSPL